MCRKGRVEKPGLSVLEGLRHHLDPVKLVRRIWRVVVIEGGRSAGWDNRANRDHWVSQVGSSKDLVINVGHAVPNDQLLSVLKAGDSQNRVRVKRISPCNEFLVVGHAIAVGITGADDRNSARVTKIKLI